MGPFEAAIEGTAAVDAYPVKTVAPGVHVFGPHRVRFWLGNYSPLAKRFAQLVEAIEDKAGADYAQARKFVDMMDLDRAEFARIADDEAPYWLVNMRVVELGGPDPGLLVYSPTPLDEHGRLKAALDALGPVRVVVAPHVFHTAGLASFRQAYPEAHFLCPKASQLSGGKTLLELRPELRFAAMIEDRASIDDNPGLAALIGGDVIVDVMDDAANNELVLYHRPAKAFINADTVYKAAGFEAVAGVGGPLQAYMGPDWFAGAYQVLNIDPSPSPLLPDNRAFLARHPAFDRDGFLASLERVVARDLDWMICCHTDPLAGPEARDTLLKSWQWLDNA